MLWAAHLLNRSGLCRMEKALPVAIVHFPSHSLRAGHGQKFPAAQAGIADQGTAAGSCFGKREAEARPNERNPRLFWSRLATSVGAGLG